MKKLIAIALIAFGAAKVQADVKLPAILSDNMCLQANKALPIWGKADPGEQITVRLGDPNHTLGEQKESTTTDQDGNWKVMFHPFPDACPLAMTVAGKNTIVVKNIIVGEVWIASGQSNMEFGFGNSHNSATERPRANHPTIRIFNLKKHAAFEPQWDCEGKWEECSPQTVDHTTAVGYFFAREINEKLGIPVGLIHTSWGGTPAQAWTSVEGLKADPQISGYAESYQRTRENLPQEMEKYRSELLPKWEEARRKWEVEYGQADEATKRAHPQPRRPNSPGNDPNVGSVLFNGMIAPLIPYGIEGAIWYQGESNAGNAVSTWQYRTLFPAMITDWRNHWAAANPDEKDFPFCFVQLTNYEAGKSDWPGLREAQHLTLKLPNTGEAVIIDIGDPHDIHPHDKMDVGKRLALAAEHIAYHKDIIFSGPTYAGMRVEGNKIRIKFENVGSGLMIAAAPSTQPDVPQAEPASELKGFSIAGEDKEFVAADAKIDGDSVIVWSDKVSDPVAVRYAWANNPQCNLYNKERLPASPFRTDDWGGPVKK